MNFSFESGFLCFHSDRPGSHATLLAPHGQNQPMYRDLCSFNDLAGKYKWVFFAPVMPLAEGDKVTFATVEYDVTCVFEGGGFRILPEGEGQKVEREEGTGRPLGLVAWRPVSVVSAEEQRPVVSIPMKKEAL